MRVLMEDLRKSYPTPAEPLVVLDGVDLDLAAGDALSVAGPSGCGKSTLLYILGTLDRPTSGSVAIDGADPFSLSEAELARFRGEKIGFVFQDHYLLPQCTVLENVLVPSLVASGGGADAGERARELLEQVGLGARVDHRPSELSGGERQRAAVARALIRSPGLLLCDEPTGNLDQANAERIGDLLLALREELGYTLVVVTHSLDLSARFPRRASLRGGVLEESL
ncbi:MAG: ABC transporter ATP-binding protein [Planctomycetes bacterium]|nr:ABC transporter ATP-binding protein [Planctomycetota bacterium]